jgi:chemotaxis protein histidine kinase CheA
MDLRDRVLARYKTGAQDPILGNDPSPMDQMDEATGTQVTGASGLPGGDAGGPGKRNIPKNHPYDPRALKPLSQMLWAMSVSLGHALTAYRKFARLKSATISPDGMLGGRGYVMDVKEIRSKLHDACESLSAISDTIHDEINAPHWQPKMNELDPSEALDVRKFIQESQQILQNPEEDAEEEMEAIEDSAQKEAEPGTEMQPETQPGAEGFEEQAEPGEEGEEAEGEEGEVPEVSPEEEEAFNQDQKGAPEGEEEEESSEEEPEEGEEDEEDEEAQAPEEDERPFGEGEETEAPEEDEESPEEVPEGEEPSEEAPEEEDEDETPYEEGDEDEESEEDEEDQPFEETSPDESYDRGGDEEDEDEDEDEEGYPEEEEDDEEEEDEDADEITPEDEALADAALNSSGMPGAGEPPSPPLGRPTKKKKKKQQIKFSPGTVQDEKFNPEMAKLGYDRTANSSVNPDSLGGPRVHHLDRADAPGQFNSENDDPPTDDWALNDGRPESDDFSFIWRAAEDDSVEQWWDTMSPEEQSEKATFLKLLSNDRSKWTSDDWEKVFLHQASSSVPDSDSDDTATDGWDFGLGYGAKGDGAGGYANPSGEGNGYQGVYGPTSGLPTDHAVKTEDDSTSKIDVEVNERDNVKAQNSLMPTDVEPPVARSDYYTDGLTDEMIAQSELPAPEQNPYTYDRDLPNTSKMFEHHDTPYIRYDYTTENYRPDPNYSRPER